MADSPPLSTKQTVVASNTVSAVQISKASTNGKGVATTVTEKVDSKVCSQSVTSLPNDESNPNHRQNASSNNPLNKLAKNFKKLRSKPQKITEQPRPDGSEDASKSRSQKTKQKSSPEDRDDPSKSKPWSFITGRISSTKSKIQNTFFANGEVLTETQKHQTDSSSVLFTQQPDVYRPAEAPDRTELEYLQRVQKEEAAAAALRNLENQDAELDSDGEGTTESVHDTVMPRSQSPERAIVENEELASTLAAQATEIAVSSPNLPAGTVSVHSEVRVNDDLLNRTGSLRVKTTRNKMPTGKDGEESRGDASPGMPKIRASPRMAAQCATAEKAKMSSKVSMDADGEAVSHPFLSKYQEWQRKIKLLSDAESRGGRFVDSYPPKSNKKPYRKRHRQTLESIQDEDEDEVHHQPEAKLPTPPESPKRVKSKDGDETELSTPPDLPAAAKSEAGTFPFTMEIPFHTPQRPSSDNEPVATLINAEGSRILRGSPPRSDVVMKFLKFHHDNMGMGIRADENMGDEEERRRMRREFRRRIAVDDFGELSEAGSLD